MKALVRERVDDWSRRLMGPTNNTLVELTGDTTPDSFAVRSASVIITTPEKWDSISRNWKYRKYVQQVGLIIMDEIHLLGSDRGPILEVIVSRMNFIAATKKEDVRIVGMSTAIANAQDLAGWLGVTETGLYNFKYHQPLTITEISSAVRPVQLEAYIDGFPSRGGYCERMAMRNRPAFMAIKNHSPEKPVLIFVSSRRQTRLTAQDLVNYCGMEENPRRFLHIPEEVLEEKLEKVNDRSLRQSLSFGIGLHHAGLTEPDRKLVEDLFLTNQIQVLVATSTLAWGVNFPAHLVVVKATEYFDAKTNAYKDMDLTDVLQMMGTEFY
jgi:antiviral helicase SLH1